MQSILVDGPQKASGEITLGGNKNAVLPMIAASLLTEEPVVLHNVPEISDVSVMLKLAALTGVQVRRTGDTVTLCAKNVSQSTLPRTLCAALRTSFLLTGPLIVRCGEASVWQPGGDFIGRRRLDSHFYGLKKFGVSYQVDTQSYTFKRNKKMLTGADLFLDEASVTATEHLLMTATRARGITIIRNAASEPHVQQLAELLNQMGAEISGIDTNTLVIHGVKKLHGTEYTIDGDHIEATSFMTLAALCRGGIELHGKIQPRHYWMARRVFERFGLKFRLEPNHIVLPPDQKMKILNDLGNVTPMISDGPWPQFPSDMMSCMIVAATQAKGSVIFFEKMFESRIYFVDRLIAMGANAVVCDPHRAMITGPAKLHGIEMSSPDIRAGMAMLLAATCAKGRSVIRNADTIFRGYDRIVEKMKQLGVEITVSETKE